MTSTTLGYAFLGGLLPSFIWLYFLLKEDAAHPEPKKLLVFTFIAGMTAVLVALPLEQFMKAALTSNQTTLTLPVIVSWALIEEVLKYLMAVVFILWRNAVDEAPDYVIYMVTVALGFASAETMIFILNYSNGNPLLGSIIGNERFLGSALLHVVASAAIGFSLAFSFRSHPAVRMTAAAGGLILAIALHTVFNMLIISTGASALTALFLVWMVAVVFFAAFEVLKYFQYRN